MTESNAPCDAEGLANELEVLAELLSKENTGSDAGFDAICLRAARALRAAAPQAQEEIQDTYFTDQRLPIMAMSGDVESDRVLKLHFRRKVTDADRARLIEALNAGETALASPPSGDAVREALENLIPTIRSVDPETTEAIRRAEAALALLPSSGAGRDAQMTALREGEK